MKTVEITYRYGAADALVRPRPPDADAAQLRLNEGNRVFARLLDGRATDSGTTHRIIDVDPGDLGLLPGEHGTPKQRPFAAVLGCSDARVPSADQRGRTTCSSSGLPATVSATTCSAACDTQSIICGAACGLLSSWGTAAVVRCRPQSIRSLSRPGICRWQPTTRFAAFSTGSSSWFRRQQGN
jgi:hypothetical protein